MAHWSKAVQKLLRCLYKTSGQLIRDYNVTIPYLQNCLRNGITYTCIYSFTKVQCMNTFNTSGLAQCLEMLDR